MFKSKTKDMQPVLTERASEDIVRKWVKRWEEERAFEADPDPRQGKVFVTFPFPYMNGPLTAGHIFSGSRVDAYARFKRMQGYNVLFPWAWHWTGQPVVSASQRLREGDPVQRRIFVEMDKVPPDELNRFTDPVYVAEYYTKENRETVRRLGFSVDWRREFHTSSHEPLFNRFVQWQYNRLRALGYVVQGTHPVVWCPKDKSPTQDHDRLEGEGVSPEEYVAVKFRLKGEETYLVAGTLRPETIYGVTNLWLKQGGAYVRARVDGETWIISRDAVGKLVEQLRSVEVLGEVDVEGLLGSICVAPLSGREVPILPARFVDTNSVTGVVYSVPAHAPYDWLALLDLKRGNLGLTYPSLSEVVESVQPVSIISVQGFGELPAVELVERMKIRDQLDSTAEQATKELYNKEFHQGRMKENCGRYSGMKVSEAKPLVVQEMKATREADFLYELPSLVICRCNTRCIVKVLEDQWFLKYSDRGWKERSVEALSKTNILPAEARQQFIQTVYWLKEYPCARKTGLGTPLPWDSEWIVETLSDSTIYMAFYTIIHQLRRNNIRAEQLSDTALNYIFLGIGDIDDVARDTGMAAQLIKSLRSEFLYWYPVNMRNSGKDLVSNHLTFFVMHHVALFDEELWPTGIGVNGMVQLEGARMSKSHGIFISAKEAISTYGPDASRATLISSAEALDDPDWRSKNAVDLQQKLGSLPEFMKKIVENSVSRKRTRLDRWLLSRLQLRVGSTTDAMEVMKTRTAFFHAFFATWNDLRWYLRRTKPEKRTVKQFFETWARLLSPFTPFTAEELNERLGGDKLVSLSHWPEPDSKLVDQEAELAEELIETVIDDLKGIISVIKSPVSEARILVADSGTTDLLRTVTEQLKSGKNEGDIMKYILGASEADSRRTQATLAQMLLKYCRDVGLERLDRILRTQIDEAEILEEASEFIRGEVGLTVVRVERGRASTELTRGRQPLPLKPLIILK
jgi:leucyl-tRNA synthetase